MSEVHRIAGLHHVTAIAGDPQQNIDFYVGVLGLRLVKRTINFDDPGTYHFYFGDARGSPGTIITFFPWAGARRGRRGTGQIDATAFAIPVGSIGYWQERLKGRDVRPDLETSPFGEETIRFADRDGLMLELVASDAASNVAMWDEIDVPPEFSICGFFGVSAALEGYERTARLLSETFGYQLVAESGNRFRFAAAERGDHSPGRFIDLVCLPDAPRAGGGAGSVHHIAFRAKNDEEQRAWREQIVALGYNVSPVMDRTYFHSIYFREPGGVLFEIATDAPGFTLDESPEQLGGSLRLPPWLEKARTQIEEILPPITLPLKPAP